MLVREGIVEKMFIEPDLPGDPFQVSDADTMLDYIAPNAVKPKDVTIFTRNGCEHCVSAKGLLRDSGFQFEELVLNREYSEATLRTVSGRASVPEIFINGTFIGGAEELEPYLQDSKGCLITDLTGDPTDGSPASIKFKSLN